MTVIVDVMMFLVVFVGTILFSRRATPFANRIWFMFGVLVAVGYWLYYDAVSPSVHIAIDIAIIALAAVLVALCLRSNVPFNHRKRGS